MRGPSLFLVGLLLFLGSAPVLARARRPPLPMESVTALSDGRNLKDVRLVQVEGAPCVSLRDLQRLVGGSVSWRRLAREVSLVRERRSVTFILDSSTASVEGRTVRLDAPVRWWTGQPYIPLTFILSPPFQSFACATILWDPGRKVLAATPLPDVSSPRFTAQADRTRVSFDLASRVEHRVLREGPGVLVLRFFGGRAGPREKLQVADPLITAVDILPRRHSTDVIFTLSPEAGRPRVYLEESPRRLTVEARRAGAEEPVSSEPAEAEEEGGARLPSQIGEELPVLLPAPLPGASVPGRKSGKARPRALDALSPVHVIVVDPGHGGRDVGAVGRRGTMEKDVNLAVAQALAESLRAEDRYEVHLTRETDDFVSLQDRAEFANRIKADLFISVHCNAALTPHSNGFEIYFLSEHATDDAAAAVARRENASLELEGPAGKAQAKVAQLLWSLAKTEDLNESSEVAALVHQHARRNLEVESRGVKQAGFYVLKWARMPAVLVESAFITNPKEEKLLRSSGYLDKIVKTVVAGVKDYEQRKVQARLGKNGASGGS